MESTQSKGERVVLKLQKQQAELQRGIDGLQKTIDKVIRIQQKLCEHKETAVETMTGSYGLTCEIKVCVRCGKEIRQRSESVVLGPWEEL